MKSRILFRNSSVISRWAARILPAVGALFFASVASCNADDQKPHYGGTLNVGVASDAKTFHPFYALEFTERQVEYLVFDTLVKYGPDFSIHPDLAKSWSIEDGGKRVVLKLQSGVKFHDGTDFNAQAVKWNFDERLDPAIASPQRSQLAPVIKSVEVVDPLTVAINLKAPFAGLFSLLGERPGFMVSPTATAKAGKDISNALVGTGPFIFKQWVRGSQVVLEKNPSYWRKGLPYLDRIVFHNIAGSVIGVQRLMNGELDFISELSSNDVRVLSGNPNIVLAPLEAARWYSLQWQVDKPPFNNAKLRQAIAYGIDRQRIIAILTGGKGTLSNGPTPPTLWWYDASLKSYAYDPAKAKALLAAAGYPSGLHLTLSAPEISAFQQIDQLVQEQLGAIGISVTLQPVSSGEWYDRILKRETNFTPTRWTQRADPDGLIYILFDSKGYQNSTGYQNAKVDDLLQKGRTVYGEAERRVIYAQVQAQLAEDLPMLPLYFSTEYGALGKDVHGFAWVPDEIARFAEVWK
ncbi:MAG: ABC transporter substrate-binding protein [Pseudomonadota bacterium]